MEPPLLTILTSEKIYFELHFNQFMFARSSRLPLQVQEITILNCLPPNETENRAKTRNFNLDVKLNSSGLETLI